MSRFVKTTIDELARMICSLKFEEVLTFATDNVGDISQDESNFIDSYENWFYVQKCGNISYASRYWVVDYCGGGFTCAHSADPCFGFCDYMVAKQISDYLRSMNEKYDIPFNGTNVYIDMEGD